MLSAATLEDKVEWEELVREQIWNASTTDEVSRQVQSDKFTDNLCFECTFYFHSQTNDLS